jgi:hypothetical protein
MCSAYEQGFEVRGFKNCFRQIGVVQSCCECLRALPFMLHELCFHREDSISIENVNLADTMVHSAAKTMFKIDAVLFAPPHPG